MKAKQIIILFSLPILFFVLALIQDIWIKKTISILFWLPAIIYILISLLELFELIRFDNLNVLSNIKYVSAILIIIISSITNIAVGFSNKFTSKYILIIVINMIAIGAIIVLFIFEKRLHQKNKAIRL